MCGIGKHYQEELIKLWMVKVWVGAFALASNDTRRYVLCRVPSGSVFPSVRGAGDLCGKGWMHLLVILPPGSSVIQVYIKSFSKIPSGLLSV